MALSPKAKEKLIAFRDLGNPGDLHAYDRERWNEFVIQAHVDGDEAVEDSDVTDVLREKWVEKVAVEMGSQYFYERLLLRDYDLIRRQ